MCGLRFGVCTDTKNIPSCKITPRNEGGLSAYTDFSCTVKEYFAIYRSKKPMVARLTEHQIMYTVKQRSSNKSVSAIALEPGVSKRRIEQLYAKFCRTGLVHMPLKPETLARR